VNDLSSPGRRERQLAALGPLLAAAGVFVHPVASTIMPFVVYVAIRNRNLPFAALSALRAADLAFSIYLWHVIASLVLAALGAFEVTAGLASRQTMTIVTAALLLYFLVSLGIGLVLALRGRGFRYLLSFRLAERVFGALQKTA
jgi:uncharacterized Tic20 family protein